MGYPNKVVSLVGKSSPSPSGLYIEDVFSTYLYTGNGSTQTITNGIDLAGEGGLVWIKQRGNLSDHSLIDTARGVGFDLATNATDASSAGPYLTSFDTTGFTLSANGSGTNINRSGKLASWTFRKAPKFFDVVTYTGTGANRTVAHGLGSVPGCIIVKRTDTTGDWQVYHRANTANPETDYLVLNSTAATADSNTRWNDTLPTATEFSLGTEATVNASGGTYVAYLFAHDAGGFGQSGLDNVISCGSYVGNSSTTGPIVTLGWEPQWLLIKNASTTSLNGWRIYDSMRGMGDSAGPELHANTTAAETTGGQSPRVTATGFEIRDAGLQNNQSGSTYIYIAIRRGPMKTPTTGTSVYNAASRGPGTNKYEYAAGFLVDFALNRLVTGSTEMRAASRLTGGGYLQTPLTLAETGSWYLWDDMTTYSAGETNSTEAARFAWMFRRAPGFFDVVAYTGTGSATTVAHNLGVAPELIIAKSRNQTLDWPIWNKTIFDSDSRNILYLNGSNGQQPAQAVSTMWDSTAPTASVFTVGTNARVNNSGYLFVAYLFATLPGVSKVGSYTGNGTSQTINCGFSTGARFVLIKRTDNTGDWYVWDTARGIVAGNDPHLSLNTTAVEVTGDDSVDVDNSGFVVNQDAATDINVNAATYIFLAIA